MAVDKFVEVTLRISADVPERLVEDILAYSAFIAVAESAPGPWSAWLTRLT